MTRSEWDALTPDERKWLEDRDADPRTAWDAEKAEHRRVVLSWRDYRESLRGPLFD